MTVKWNDAFLVFDRNAWETGWREHHKDNEKPKPRFLDCVTVNDERIRWSAKSASRPEQATFWLWAGGAWRQVPNLVALVQGWCRRQLLETDCGKEARGDWERNGISILKGIIGTESCMFQDFQDQPYMDKQLMPVFTEHKVFLVARDGSIKEKEPNPEYRNLWAIPHEVVFDKPTPNFDKMLSDYGFGKDDQKTIRQLIAYCLSPLNLYPQFAFFTGGGKNGKSTLLSLIRRTVGPRNASSIPLEALNDQSIEKLSGVLANLPSENTKGTINEELLKVMAGGETRNCNPKYRDPYDIQLRAKNLFAFNALPVVRDVSDAFWRRAVIIRFTREIKTADPFFLRTLQAEIPAILGRCIRELAELVQHEGRVYLSPTIKMTVADFRADSSSSQSWLDDLIKEAAHSVFVLLRDDHIIAPKFDSKPFASWLPKARTFRIHLSHAYTHYSAWAKEYGYRPLGKKEWTTRLLQMAESPQEKRWRRKDWRRERYLECVLAPDDAPPLDVTETEEDSDQNPTFFEVPIEVPEG